MQKVDLLGKKMETDVMWKYFKAFQFQTVGMDDVAWPKFWSFRSLQWNNSQIEEKAFHFWQKMSPVWGRNSLASDVLQICGMTIARVGCSVRRGHLNSCSAHMLRFWVQGYSWRIKCGVCLIYLARPWISVQVKVSFSSDGRCWACLEAFVFWPVGCFATLVCGKV